MVCTKCGSEKVVVTTEQISSKTKESDTSLFRKIGRAILVMCTCGFWCFVPKKKETEKTKYKNRTVVICQNCGHKWSM